MKTRSILVLTTIALLIGVLFVTSFSGKEEYEVLGGLEAEEAMFYTSFSCGCCDMYVSYTERQTGMDLNVEKFSSENLNAKKTSLGVPSNLRSCHTMMIQGYFIEGHVPLEAVDKLLMEKPDIKGIVLPGMPGGSPGMPGAKTQEFVITAVNHDGSTYEFMRL